MRICDQALSIVVDGRAAQEQFIAIMFAGISQEEMEVMKWCNRRILENINQYRKESAHV